MARLERATKVTELGQKFIDSVAAVLTEYRGLTVKDLQDLRRSFGGDATYTVAKNTLALLAAWEADIDGIEPTLVEPTVFTFITGDIVKVTKGLRDSAKAHLFLVIRGDVLGGKFLDTKAVLKLAGFGSYEVLLSRMIDAMKDGLAKAVGTPAAPLLKSVHLLDALQSAARENPGLIGGAGSAPATKATDKGAAADDITPAEEAWAVATAGKESVAT